MNKLVILTLMSVCSRVLGATYYVDAVTGNNARNTTEAQNPITPWKTISKAIQTVGSGANTIYIAPGLYAESLLFCNGYNTNGNLTISPKPGTSGEVIIGTNNYCVYGHPNLLVGSGCRAVFNNITFRPVAGTSAKMIDNEGELSLTFNNCSFNCVMATGQPVFWLKDIAGANHTRTLEVNDCQFNFNAINCMDFFSQVISGTISYAKILIHHNDIIGISKRFMPLDGIITSIDVHGNIVTAISNDNMCDGVNGDRLDGNNDFFVYDNTFTNVQGGVIQRYCAKNVYICDNTITVKHSSSPIGGILLGVNDDTNPYPMGRVICNRNTVNYAVGSHRKHCMLIGIGANGAEAAYNILAGGDYGLVIKCSHGKVHHNVVSDSLICGLYVNQSQYGDFQYNSVRINSGDAFAYSDYDNTPPAHGLTPIGNIIKNNIFDASGGGLYCIHDLCTSDYRGHNNNFFDYNCLYQVVNSYRHLAGIAAGPGLPINNFDTLDELRSAWKNTLMPVTWTMAEENSISAEPQFISSTDSRLKASSPCLNAGEPSSLGDTTIGAWQGQIQASQCSTLFDADFNGDCTVDLADFAVFADSWLKSGN